jgi:phenylalanyl-tRNA synthetase beta chain
MRSTLLPRMLMTVAENSRYQSRVALFEIASVYLPRVGQALPDEPEHLAIAMTGPRHIQWWGENQGEAEIDFYDLKGVIETLFDRLNIEGFTFAPSSSPIFQPGRAAEIHMGETTIGVMGEIHPLVREAFELPDQRIAALELGLPELFAHVQGITYYEAISRFPLVTQDLALIVDEEVPAAQVRSLILQAGQEAIANVRLFDVYRGEAITEGKKSLAYAISYQNMERTLTDEDVNQIRDRIVDHVQQEVNAQVRR